MRVKCVSTKGYQFAYYFVKKGLASPNKVEFEGLSLDKSYVVYGISIFDEELTYLIYDDYEMAAWYAANLFHVESTALPENWHHRYFGRNEQGLSAIWGYKELVHSMDHYDGLLNRVRDEVILFLKRKREIDSWETE